VIWVWSVRAESRGVKVTAKTDHVGTVNSPRFAVCPDLHGSVCDLGNLPVGQPDELQATVRVHKAAALGDRVRLTAEAKAPAVATFRASATILIVAPSAPAPAPGTSSPAGDTVPPETIPPAPALPSSGGSLFPTVKPSPTASPGSVTPAQAKRHHDGIQAATASATLPLNPRLIGGQLAGLAVLAGAIAMAIARLSLRAPKPQGAKDPSK
jgi:hypothetical protein